MTRMIVGGIVVIGTLIFGMLAIAASPQDKPSPLGERRVAKDKDLLAVLQAVNASDGTVLGFRVEVVNTSTDKSLVVVTRKDVESICRLKLVDSGGHMIYIPPKDMSRGSSTAKGYRHDVILPQTAHAWFLLIPNEVSLPGNQGPIKKDQYTATITFVTSAFRQDKNTEVIPEDPEYETLSIDLPSVKIGISPESLKSESMIDRFGQ